MVSSSSSTPKRYRHGTHRACDPAKTLARISGYFPALGITRLADVTGLDSIGIPVCVAIRPNARSLSVSQGKGPTLESAKVSAVMESLETYHAENISKPLVEGSYREVIRHSAACDPLLLTLEPLSIYHEDLPLKWIAGFDLLQQSNVLAPYDLVHCNYLAEPLKRPIFLMSSNGLASGNHVIEALSHAICEVVERDAGYLWELQTLDVTADSRLLDLSTVDSEVCRDLLEKFDAANISVSVWDQTSDVGLPVLGCALIEHHPARLMHRLGPYTGFGCHLSREIALARALTEAAQSRLTHIAGSRDDMYRSSYEGFRSEKYAAGLIQRVMDMQPGVDYHDLPTLETDSLEGDLSIQLDLVKRAGFNQVIWVDLTQSQIGIPVVRVIIPGMEFKVSHRGLPTRISQRTRERLLKMRLFAQLRGVI